MNKTSCNKDDDVCAICLSENSLSCGQPILTCKSFNKCIQKKIVFVDYKIITHIEFLEINNM